MMKVLDMYRAMSGVSVSEARKRYMEKVIAMPLYGSMQFPVQVRQRNIHRDIDRREYDNRNTQRHVILRNNYFLFSVVHSREGHLESVHYGDQQDWSAFALGLLERKKREDISEACKRLTNCFLFRNLCVPGVMRRLSITAV